MEIMNSIRKQDSKVQVIHHHTTRGIGFGYKEGIRKSTKEYFMYLPGDDDFEENSIRTVFEQMGKSDIVIPFHVIIINIIINLIKLIQIKNNVIVILKNPR